MAKTHFRLAWDVRMQMLVLHERWDDQQHGAYGSGMQWFDKADAETVIDGLTQASPFQQYALKRHAKRIIKGLRPIRNKRPPEPEHIPDPETSARVEAALRAAAANLVSGLADPTYEDYGSVILDHHRITF